MGAWVTLDSLELVERPVYSADRGESRSFIVQHILLYQPMEPGWLLDIELHVDYFSVPYNRLFAINAHVWYFLVVNHCQISRSYVCFHLFQPFSLVDVFIYQALDSSLIDGRVNLDLLTRL